MRLIDADVLKQKLIELYESDPYPENNYMDGWTFIDFSREALRPMIDEQPTIEVITAEEYTKAINDMSKEYKDFEPVKHGTWGENIYGYRKCSVCGRVTQVDECMREPLYRYCPYCGAKMDGGKND